MNETTFQEIIAPTTTKCKPSMPPICYFEKALYDYIVNLMTSHMGMVSCSA